VAATPPGMAGDTPRPAGTGQVAGPRADASHCTISFTSPVTSPAAEPCADDGVRSRHALRRMRPSVSKRGAGGARGHGRAPCGQRATGSRPRLQESVYAHLAPTGVSGPSRTACALHQAVRRPPLRENGKLLSLRGLVAGVEFGGAVQVGQGFLFASQQPVGLPPAADGLRVAGVAFDGAVQVGHGLVVAAQREIGLAARLGPGRSGPSAYGYRRGR
jgi:hypothetical protein